MLEYIAARQVESGLNHTPRLKRVAIATALGIPQKSVAKQISRLEQKGCLVRVDALSGRADSGTVYFVPPEVRVAIQNNRKGRQLPETTGDNNRRQLPETPVVVSSNINTSSTTATGAAANDRQLVEQFTVTCERFGLGEFSVGANDLLQAWRKQAFSDPKDLIDSCEHLAFYLSSPAAKGISSPKAWFMSNLLKGYYAAPAGFVCWSARQEEARLRDAKLRLDQVREAQRKRFEIELEIWLMEIEPAKKRNVLRSTPFADNPSSPLAKSVLRQEFAKERGFDLQLLINE